jgi:hypothetical protein
MFGCRAAYAQGNAFVEYRYFESRKRGLNRVPNEHRRESGAARLIFKAHRCTFAHASSMRQLSSTNGDSDMKLVVLGDALKDTRQMFATGLQDNPTNPNLRRF